MKRFNRLIALLLMLAMLLPMVPAMSVHAAEWTFAGSGTAEDPYLIETAAHFTEMAEAVIAGTTFEGMYFEQTADLDFTDSAFNGMIGDSNEIFAGVYDGKGYVMENIDISGQDYNAVFGIIYGTVMNVGIESGTISGAVVASLARTVKNGGKLVNCYSKAAVNGTTRGAGLVNYVTGEDCVVENCWFAGSATQNAVIGYQWNATNLTATKNYYLNGSASGGTAAGTATAMAEADMKAAAFVETLNSNHTAAAAACGIDASALNSWIAVENGYPVMAASVEEPEVTYSFSGSGTAEDPYLIETAAHFKEMADAVIAGTTFAGMYFEQTADLDFTDSGFTGMIGDEFEIFAGIYDGKGHVMTNVTISGQNYNGLFGVITGTVMNLGIESGTVSGAVVASLARTVKNGGKLINCYSKATVNGTTRGAGLVNYVTGANCVVENCWFAGSATQNAVIGYQWNATNLTATSNYYLTGSASGGTAAGTATAMAEADMKAEAFVTTLNGNIAVAAEAAGLETAQLVNWAAGENDYPVMTHAGSEPAEEIYGQNLALNKTAAASALEAGATEASHGAHLTVDGLSSTNVSLSKTVDDPSVTIDLGKVYKINQIIVSFESCPENYEVQYSVDGETFITVGSKERSELAEAVTAKVTGSDTYKFDTVEARYVRYQQLKGWKWDLTTRTANMAGNPTEIEVYLRKDTGADNSEAIEALGEKLFTFGVMSDTEVYPADDHIDNQHFDAALKQFLVNDPDSSALFIVGDVVARGLQAHWEKFQEITSEENNPGLPDIYCMVGNHDVTDDGTYAELYANFLTYSGMENTYYDTWINGYHFICLGQEDTGHNVPYFSEEQFAFLEEKLAENASSDKPIFVFNHYPLRNTTAGSHLGSEIGHSIGSVDKLRFMELLKQYPQVILFNAHTHFALTDEDTHYNVDQVDGNGADIFNTGVISYIAFGTYESKTGAQHQYVEVYEKGVRVRGWDVVAESWIEGADYIIDTTSKETTEMATPKIELDKTEVTPANGETLTAYITYEDTERIEAADGAWVGIVSSNEEGTVGKVSRWVMLKDLETDDQGRYVWDLSDDAVCGDPSTEWLRLASGEKYIGLFEDVLYLGTQPTVPSYSSYQYDPYGRVAKASFNLIREVKMEGSGTKEDPYLIADAADFVEFAEYVVSGESFSDQYVVQTADLDFSNVEYSGMVGDSIEIFDGIYDGRGYTMSNITISGSTPNSIFGIVTGTVMNVGIESATISGNYVGGLARCVKDGGKIVNCYSKASVTGSGRGTGLVDYITGTNAIISNCWFAGSANGNAVTGSSYNSTSPVVDKVYYQTGSASGATAAGTATAMSEADMKAAAFVETLNSNRAAAAAACGIETEELVNWTVSEDNYPVMAHEGDPGTDEEVYGVNLALNKNATASGLESGATEEKHGAHLVVDGDGSTNVSLIKTVDDPSITIDLGKVCTFNQIVIKFESCPENYEIQYSVDGEEWITIGGKERESLATAVTDKVSGTDTYDFAEVEAQYVRYQQIKGWTWDLTTRQAKMAGNPYEIEVYYQDIKEIDLVMDQVATVAPTLDWENGTIVLPESPNEGYVVTLEGSDNQQVITNEGKLYQPLVDMTVHLVYRVTSVADPEETAIASENAVIVVPGKYQKEDGDNAVPNVMPGLREWKGHTGNFTFTENSRIVISTEALRETAVMIASFFTDMIGVTPEIVTGAANSGDVVLTMDSTAPELGDEGYSLNVGDTLVINAPTTKGVLYGGISIVQILYQDDDHKDIPKGVCRDYPKYEVRAGMIDVGRLFVPIDYLEQIAKYMAWFKMSELHVHINDDIGYDNAFRVESKLYPAINEGGQYYAQEDYRQFQKNAMAYGIDIVTEIDAPAHASALGQSGAVDMLTGSYMDISTDAALEKTLAFVQSLCDEFLDGEDPVFQSSKFHIGTDEYSTAYSEQMRKYTDAMIKYVNAKGLECRLWGSCSNLASPHGFKGETPVSSDATMNLWDIKWTNLQEMYDDGYQIINTSSGHLYIVPGGAGHPTFHPNRLYLEQRYKDFEVNIFKEFRTAEPYVMPLGLPQTKGAEFAMWNDTRVGLSQYDVFDRMKDGIFLIAEKTWYGEDTEDQTVEDFLARIDAVDDKAPQSNPGASVESETSILAGYDFESVENGTVADLTANGYEAAFDGSTAEGETGNALVFTGSETLELPVGTVGFPYTVSFDLKLDADNPAGAKLFDGEDGTLYFAEDGTLLFERFYDYTFKFNTVLPEGKWINIALTCDEDATTLYVDGKAVKAQYVSTGAGSIASTTFVLPAESIGSGMKGMLDNLYISDSNTALKIASAAETESITVELGTEFAQIENLPGQVAVKLSGDTKATSLTVAWEQGDYNGNAPGTYAITGTLLIPEAIVNQDGKKITVDVIVNGNIEAVEEAVDLISSIGEVDINSGEKISAARAAYDALTDAEKGLVSNYEILTDAEAEYQKILAQAAQAEEKAQAAQAAAEEAQKAAETAQEKADAAKQKAGEADAVAGADKSKAEQAHKEAQAAQTAADEAKKAAQDAQTAAELSAKAAKEADLTTAASAALAADYAKEAAQTNCAIAELKLEMVEQLVLAQESIANMEKLQQAAQAAALASAKYQALMELTMAADKEGHGAPYAEILEEGSAAIQAAQTEAEVAQKLTEAKAALQAAQTCPSAKFEDVLSDGWYHASVDYMVGNGYMQGMSDTLFDVNGTLTRAQLVTILYRIEGSPDVAQKENPFADVAADTWYTDAVIWAADQGVVKGTSETTFAPNAAITREQIVTILYRYANSPEGGKDLHGFADSGRVSAYAVDAMSWAVNEGIVMGTEKNNAVYLEPMSNASRVQCAAILERFLALD